MRCGYARNLRAPKRARELVETVLDAAEREAFVRDEIGLGQFIMAAVMAKGDGALVEAPVVGGHHAGLAGDERLGRHTRHGGEVADRAGHAPFVQRAVRVRDVFDDADAVRFGHDHDGIHVGGVTGVVHGDDGFGARRDAVFDVRGIDAQRVRQDVGKDGRAAELVDRQRRRPVRHAWADDLVTRADACRKHRPQQRRRAVTEREAMLDAKKSREVALKLSGDIDARHVAVPQHVQHGRFVLGRDDRPRKRVARI